MALTYWIVRVGVADDPDSLYRVQRTRTAHDAAMQACDCIPSFLAVKPITTKVYRSPVALAEATDAPDGWLSGAALQLWTEARVRAVLPQVQIRVTRGSHTCVVTADVRGRARPFATVYPRYDSGAMGDYSYEFSWAALARSLNLGHPLTT